MIFLELVLEMNLFDNPGLLSVMSGVLAACCGMLGKLGLDTDHSTMSLTMRGVLVTLTLVLNSAMMTLYTRALSLSPVSAVASTINTAANLASTALLSYLVFQEALSVQWCAGALLSFIGVSLLFADQNENNKKEKTS